MAFLFLQLHLAYSVTDECVNALIEYQRGVNQFIPNLREPWFNNTYSEMFYYSGHDINDLGNYDKCNEISQAKYVVIQAIQLPLVVIGFCGPKNCTTADYIDIILNRNLTMVNQLQLRDSQYAVSLDVFDPQDAEDYQSEISVGFGFMIAFIVILLIVISAATIFDIINKGFKKKEQAQSEIHRKNSMQSSFIIQEVKKRESKLALLLQSFSAYSNCQKIFTVPYRTQKETLDILNGIRVLCILWVIFGHVASWPFERAAVANVVAVDKQISQAKYVFIYGAYYSVDAFFWLGGVLQGYLITKELQKKKRLPWLWVYLHRFIRLLPLYLFLIFFWWSSSTHFGSGPLWHYMAKETKDCKDYWWIYPTFISNLYFPIDDGYVQCFPISWYISNDMQFFLITPPLLYLYVVVSPILGWIITGMMSIGSVIAAAITVHHYDLSTEVLSPKNGPEYFKEYYYMPYIRVGAYIIGIWTGWILLAHRNKQEKISNFDKISVVIAKIINKKPIVRWIMYTIALGVTNFLMFIQITAYQDYDEGDTDPWTLSENTAFLSTNHLVWTIAFSLLIIPVLLGHMKVVYNILAAGIWAPPAKLVFGVYLTHICVLDVYLYSREAAIFWNMEYIVLTTTFIACIAFTISLAVTLLVESPVMGLERVLRGGSN